VAVSLCAELRKSLPCTLREEIIHKGFECPLTATVGIRSVVRRKKRNLTLWCCSVVLWCIRNALVILVPEYLLLPYNGGRWAEFMAPTTPHYLLIFFLRVKIIISSCLSQLLNLKGKLWLSTMIGTPHRLSRPSAIHYCVKIHAKTFSFSVSPKWQNKLETLHINKYIAIQK
jgi:hypothetical protein